MSVLEIKNDLLRLVVETNDAELLNTVRNYFKTLKKEPISAEELAAQENRMIDLGLTQINAGNVISNGAAQAKIKTRLQNKSNEQN